jgi:uncharacterized protein with HEPN domain
MKNSLFYVEHIRDAINAIEEYVTNADFENFSANRLLFDAVVRELEIIGEAANSISKDFQDRYPDIPWRKIIGTRNKIAHEYFSLSKKTVWETCQNDLPELKKIIQEIISESRH